MYYYGTGVPQDRAEAERWYQKAADQGDAYAQRALGLRWNLSSLNAVSLWAMFLWCMWALKDAILPQRNTRHQPRTLTIGATCGLIYVALSLYGHFSVFKAMLTANVFHFSNCFAAGIGIAMFISVFGPKRTKIVLAISGILLVMIDLPVIWRHEVVTRFVATVHGFSSMNGLLIGLTVPLGILLWLQASTQNKLGA